MSNYPDGAANDPRAPWNQPDEIEHEPEWYFFEKVEHVAVKATSAADAQYQIDSLFNKPNFEILYTPEANKDL